MSSLGSVDSDDNGSSGSTGSVRGTYPSQTASASRDGRKKQKVTRSKTACLPCRARRTRCGALPPEACPSCTLHGLECVWPPEDGRRKRGRPRTKSLREEDGGSRRLDSSEAIHRAANIGYEQQHISNVALTTPQDLFPRAPGDSPQRNSPSDHVLPATSFPTWDTENFLSTMDFPPWQHDANQSGFENDNTLADLATVDPIPGPSRLPFDPSVEASSLRKLTTLRFHGRTGTVPGFERCEIDSSPDTLNDTLPMTLDQHTLPRTPIIQHILNLYFTHFACRFPFFVRSDVREDSPQFPFLFHCIGALVARFSDHPEICDPSSPRHTLGKIFLEQARRQVGSMMGIPSRETILGLLLLVEAALGSGSRTEMWMFMGMAVRLTLDSTLHMSKTDHVEIPETDRYRDRLLFWSVLVMDYSLSFAEGRKTSIRSDEITQELPREDEMPRSGLDQDEGRLRSPFPFAAEMIMTFGPAIDIFNDPSTNSAQQEQRAASIRELRARVAAQYDELPLDMMWNAANLQKHYRAGQGAMYLFLHLWNHTIQCSKYLYDPGKEVESIASFGPTGKSDQLTVQSIQAGSWLHCARFVGDMLVLADVIDPHLYLAIPSVNYCFFVAGRCFSEDLKARQRDDDLGLSEPAESGDASRKKEDMARALFKAITFENIKSLKQGIAKQAAFWRGIGPTLSTFESDVNALPAPAQPLGSFQQTSMLSADRLPVSSAVTGMHLAQTPRADGIDLSRPDPMSADNRIMSVARNSDLNAMFSAFQSSDLSSTGWSWLNSARPSAAVSPMDIYQLLGMEKG